MRAQHILAAGAFLALGCSHLRHHTTGFPSTLPKPTEAQGIKTYMIGEAPPRPYTVLGKIYVEDKINYIGADYTEELILKKLCAAAAQVGAEAIIGTHSMPDARALAGAKYQRWASGIAVRWEKAKKRQGPQGPLPYAVAVATPKLVEPAASWQDSAGTPLEKITPAWLQVQLESKGYYALSPQEEAAPPAPCPLILECELVEASENAVQSSGRWSTTLKRRGSEEVIWSRQAVGSFNIVPVTVLATLFLGPVGTLWMLISWPFFSSAELIQNGDAYKLDSLPNAEGRADLQL